MINTDDEILDAVCALPDGAPAWLFTVVGTWGSSPRPPGSLLLIDGHGRQTGSVSGGCVEQDLVERVRGGRVAGGTPASISFGADPGESARLGLPCGGRLDLMVERVEASAQWHLLRQRVAAREAVERRVCLRTGEVSLHAADPRDAFRLEPGASLSRVFGPRWQMVIIGATHIARFLVPIVQSLSYRTVVCDPREDQREAWDLSGTELDPGMPDDVVAARADDPRSAVVALTHDPKLDDLALMQALTGRAFYVGALGSRRTQQSRRARLAELGLAPEQIARLHGPVGLPIGGRTPPEIAVAIAAEIVAIRYGRDRVLAEDGRFGVGEGAVGGAVER